MREPCLHLLCVDVGLLCVTPWLTHARPVPPLASDDCSASGDGKSISTMTINEYWQLLKDCHIASSGHGDTKSARLDLIFIKSNQRTGLPDTGQLNPDQYEGSVRKL